MKIKCIECNKIHMTEGWIPLYKPKKQSEKSVCEVHITCACLNKMTVEHSHSQELCYREAKDVTLTLGCEIITKPGEEVSYYHDLDDVRDQYYQGPKYDKWTTPADTELYY